MAQQQKAEIGKTKVKISDENEEQKIQRDRAEQLMKEGGEINVLDAKKIEIDSPEMSK